MGVIVGIPACTHVLVCAALICARNPACVFSWVFFFFFCCIGERTFSVWVRATGVCQVAVEVVVAVAACMCSCAVLAALLQT